MLLNYSSYIAYICPYCGRLTERSIGIFDIKQNGISLTCGERGCGAEIVTIKPKKDKYMFEVLCTACGEKHRMNFKTSSFWQRKKAVISCPETSVDILFFGDRDEVRKELKQQDEMYQEAEASIASDPELHLYFAIIAEVNAIAKKGNVGCSGCGSNAVDIELTDEGLRLECRGCGAQRIIGITPESLEELLDAGTIVLE